MSEATEEAGRPGRRSSSGSGFGRARGRGRSRGRGVLGIAQQQQRVPGRQPTTPSPQSNNVPESTTLTQDQFQDSELADNYHEVTDSTGLTLQVSPKPVIQAPSQNDSTTLEASTPESAVTSSTTQNCQATTVMVSTKPVEGKQLIIIH